MVGVSFVYIDTVFGFYGYSFLCLVGCFSMIIWTPTVLSVLHACVLYFCICTCSAQLSMFHMERRSRNMLIVVCCLRYSMSLQVHRQQEDARVCVHGCVRVCYFMCWCVSVSV